MAHCGYEPTAVQAALRNPIKALWMAWRGVRTEGPMAPEIPLDRQRPAQFVFSHHVSKMLNDIHATRSDRDTTASKKPRPAGIVAPST
jgi:hypothetical protein